MVLRQLAICPKLLSNITKPMNLSQIIFIYVITSVLAFMKTVDIKKLWNILAILYRLYKKML